MPSNSVEKIPGNIIRKAQILLWHYILTEKPPRCGTTSLISQWTASTLTIESFCRCLTFVAGCGDHHHHQQQQQQQQQQRDDEAYHSHCSATRPCRRHCPIFCWLPARSPGSSLPRSRATDCAVRQHNDHDHHSDYDTCQSVPLLLLPWVVTQNSKYTCCISIKHFGNYLTGRLLVESYNRVC